MLKRALGVSYAEYAIVGFFAIVLGATSLMTLDNQMDQKLDEFQSHLDPAKVAKMEKKYRQLPPPIDGSVTVELLGQDELLPDAIQPVEQSDDLDDLTSSVSG